MATRPAMPTEPARNHSPAVAGSVAPLAITAVCHFTLPLAQSPKPLETLHPTQPAIRQNRMLRNLDNLSPLTPKDLNRPLESSEGIRPLPESRNHAEPPNPLKHQPFTRAPEFSQKKTPQNLDTLPGSPLKT